MVIIDLQQISPEQPLHNFILMIIGKFATPKYLSRLKYPTVSDSMMQMNVVWSKITLSN